MIVVNIIGGLGNQLFQYAFGKALAIKNNCELKLDISSYQNYEWHDYSLRPFSIYENFATKNECDNLKGENLSLYQKIKKRVIKKNNYIIEKNLLFNEEYKNISNPSYVSGYWQTEKYFKEIEDIIRNEFKICIPPSDRNLNLLGKIEKENAISLHVRRGDYANIKHINDVHGTTPISYYNDAIEFLVSKISNPIFYIFSDDIEWAKKNLVIKNEKFFVDFNNSKTNYEDLRLMSSCKHHVIANSTFSWWGAWLNDSKSKIVIAPKNWFNDVTLNNQTVNLIPTEWIRM
jgi:hypothetical protein